jgi:hypothetical protein
LSGGNFVEKPQCGLANALHRDDPLHAAGEPRISLNLRGARIFIATVMPNDGVNTAGRCPVPGSPNLSARFPVSTHSPPR